MRRAARRNKQKLYYALYVEDKPVMQDDGSGNLLETGEHEVVYTNPEELQANISAGRGEADQSVFGISADYHRVIALAGTDTPISETSIFWIETLPELDDSGKTETPHNYICTRVAKSLNYTLIAIRKVEVSKGGQNVSY